MSSVKETLELQALVWHGSLALEITLSSHECRVYDQAESYLVHIPRVSYLPFLLPRLHAFFHGSMINSDVIPYDGWFSFEDVPLKWQYPLGLLHDLFSGVSPYQRMGQHQKAQPKSAATTDQQPWRLTVHFTDWPEQALVRPDDNGKVLHDAFINSVKEADFLRNGTAKGIMSLSREDSTSLWSSVQEHDFSAYTPLFKKLLHAQGAPLRHVPLKVYLPTSPKSAEPNSGYLRVVQSLVAPNVDGSREAQTIGTALHSLLPTIFPSRRTPILAKPVLHGTVLPMHAPVEDLMRTAAYLDGWLHLALLMLG